MPDGRGDGVRGAAPCAICLGAGGTTADLAHTTHTTDATDNGALQPSARYDPTWPGGPYSTYAIRRRSFGAMADFAYATHTTYNTRRRSCGAIADFAHNTYATYATCALRP